MKFYRARETDGSASQTFDSGSQGQIQGKITGKDHRCAVGTKGNDSNLLIVFYVQIMPDDFVMQLHRF